MLNMSHARIVEGFEYVWLIRMFLLQFQDTMMMIMRSQCHLFNLHYQMVYRIVRAMP